MMHHDINLLIQRLDPFQGNTKEELSLAFKLLVNQNDELKQAFIKQRILQIQLYYFTTILNAANALDISEIYIKTYPHALNILGSRTLPREEYPSLLWNIVSDLQIQHGYWDPSNVIIVPVFDQPFFGIWDTKTYEFTGSSDWIKVEGYD